MPASRGARTKLGALLVATGLLTVTGCSGEFDGVYDFPLPGGADLGEHPYTVKIDFSNVLELVPRSGVQVNNVTVGNVTDIDLSKKDWTAEVTAEVNSDVDLPANTRAYVRQTSLLGEKYVALEAPPKSSAHGELGDGSVIPVERTSRSVEVEEIFGALSMLLNGGGIEQINNITDELNKALDGNTTELRSFLRNADDLVAELDDQSDNITDALDSLGKLSKTLNGQKGKIEGALDDLSPGLKVLDDQHDQIMDMLDKLDDLSDVAVDTVQESQEDTVADLEALRPSLRKLAAAGSDLPKALQLLLTFPFSDQAEPAVKGDYFNLFATVDLDLDHIKSNLGRSRQDILHSLPILGDLVSDEDDDSSEDSSDDDGTLPLPSSDSEDPEDSSGDSTADDDADDAQQQGDSDAGPGGIFDRLTPGGDN